MREIKISVRNLVQAVLRSGNIDNSYRSAARMLEGTQAHQKLQKSYGSNYQSEFSLGWTFRQDDFLIRLEGRADGVFNQDGRITIQEIKSTRASLDDLDQEQNPIHWAQVKFYGLIYMEEYGLDSLELRLSYYQLDSQELREFSQTYSREELRAYCQKILASYIDWARTSFEWIQLRDQSLTRLDFPFSSYRQGQRQAMVAAYKTIEEENRLFLQAPTGIGKTMSTIFPALKAMEKQFVEKIFYLTAKTISRQAPLKAYKILGKQGLRLKTLVISSKEKICPNTSLECNPQACSYAQGHFDRINGAIRDIFDHEDLFSREKILAYGEKHRVCPFEFSLELGEFSDLIICDYNYIFDPQVALTRFFQLKNQDYVFLVDEVHNLVDRARSMYSASLSDRDLSLALDQLAGDRKATRALKKMLNSLDTVFAREQIKGQIFRDQAVDELLGPIQGALRSLDDFLVNQKEAQGYEKVLDLYFKLLSYLKISDYYDEHFYTSFKDLDQERTIKINCMDPSGLISQSLAKARAAILFSATLAPMDYYMDLLGASGRNYHMSLASPFPRENLCLAIVDNLSIKYRDREASYGQVLAYIQDLVRSKEGNYLIFFPSFDYMEKIYDLVEDLDLLSRIQLQDRLMEEEAREDFLREFKSQDRTIGFAVLGGIFSEAIDLVGKNLIGVAIIGVGLAKLGFENNMLSHYFARYFNRGFDYAYTYPGMNKVLQGAGRLIRREEDRGLLLLIDNRYHERVYQRLLPSSWQGYKTIRSRQELVRLARDFWQENES